MTPSPTLAAPAQPAFKTGALALRIRRENLNFFVPRAWVRGMCELAPGASTPLPRTKRWVLGLVEVAGRPLPLLDPAVVLGAPPARPVAAVLIGAPERPPFALIGADAAGRFVSIPGAAHLESETDWIARVQGGVKATWWLDIGRLAAELET